MAGFCAASDVGIMCQNILGGDPIFSTSTSPNIKAVNSWITTGCAVIETHIAAAGYSVPVPSTAIAYGMLLRCNALWAAARVEESRTNISLAPGERTRGTIFDEQFGQCIGAVTSMDLTRAGLTRVAGGLIYAGGIGVNSKQTNEQTACRVTPRFSRDQFNFEGTIEPSTSTASG